MCVPGMHLLTDLEGRYH